MYRFYIAGCHTHRFIRKIAFELLQVDLNSGRVDCLYDLRVPWQDFHAKSDANFLSIQSSQLEKNLIFVPFVISPTRVSNEGRRRAGILIDWQKNSVAVISLKASVSNRSKLLLFEGLADQR